MELNVILKNLSLKKLKWYTWVSRKTAMGLKPMMKNTSNENTTSLTSHNEVHKFIGLVDYYHNM